MAHHSYGMVAKGSCVNATTTTAPVAALPDRRTATLVMACVGVFVAYMPVTTVSVSLPAIQRALHAPTSQLQWVTDAFVLPMAAFILTAGVLGDVHGRKRVFQAGLLCSAAGAATALSAHSIEVLWAGQGLAGLGAAALLPTTLALISHAVPDPRERGRYVGMWATALSAALASGPLIAGGILDHAAWRWIYLLPIPVSLIALAASIPLLAGSRGPRGRRLDWPGQLTAAVAVTALVYGVIEGGAGSFTDTEVLVALPLAGLAALTFVMVERHSPSPMLDLRLFRSPGFVGATLVAMITFLGLIGFYFVMSLYYGVVQRLTTLEAAERMIMVSGATLVIGPLVGRLTRHVTARVLITGGLLVAAGALLSLTGAEAHTSLGALSWRLALLGLGLGFVITPMTNTAVSSVPFELAGMASAGSNAFRQLGAALGPAVLGAVLSAQATSTLPGHLADAGLNGATARRITDAVADSGLSAVGRMQLGADRGRALTALGESFLGGLRLCLTVSAGLLLLAALAAAVLIRRPRPSAVPNTGTAHGGTPKASPDQATRTTADTAHLPSACRPPGPRLSGRVRDADGSGMAGATLTLVSPVGRRLGRTVARSDGTYRLDAPGSGAYFLVAAAFGHRPQARPLLLGAEPTAYDVVLPPARGLAGTVTDEKNRQPLEAAAVTVTDVHGAVLAADLTDERGGFAFRELPYTDGTVEVRATATGFRPAALPIRLSDAGTAKVHLPLRPSARLRGTVRGGAGRTPLADARVTLVNAVGDVVADVATATDGDYAFTDLDAGEYTVIAAGYPPASVHLTVDSGHDQDGLDLELAHPET